MDYHSMKRSELQALCKQHKIPANSANSVLADKLSELLNEKQKPKARQRTCIKSSVETVDENESAVSRRQSKKVRFSPEVDYERSGKKQQQAMEPVVTEVKGRRKSVARKVDKPAVDNDNTVTDDAVQIPVKLTRSRVQVLEKDNVVQTNEKKRGRKAVKDVEKETDAVKEPEVKLGKVTRSKANTVKEAEKESEPVKETVVGRARVTRSKAQTLTEDSKEPDLSPEVKKKNGRRMVKDEVKVEPPKEVKDEVKVEVKDVPVRATRSRGQTSKDDSVVEKPQVEKKRTRKDDTVVANPPIEKKRTRKDTIVADLSHDIKNEDDGEKSGRGRRKKTSDEKSPEVLENQDNADKGTRQSRRNKGKVEDDSTVLNQDAGKVETVNEKKVTRSKAPLAKTSPKGKGKSKAEVQQLEEPLKPEGKRNTRRKSVMQSVSLEVVLPLEEPDHVPVKKDTRRKSVAPKAQAKGSKKAVVEKKETVKETKIPESPNVKTSGKKQSKDASENETKEVASPSESQKSRKRKGDTVIEDETVKNEPVSTRKNSVKKQESVVKTPATRTGAKRAKLSGIKQSESGDKAEKSDTVVTPVSKMANLETDEKVNETEKTPAIDASGRRFTRGASRKEPSQSAIKEQDVGSSQLSSRKPKKFMNTAPGRFTRGAIKVDEKKQESESTHESQPVDDAEVKPSQDVTIAVPSEVSKEDEDQILEPSGDVAASEAIEENMIPTSEAPVVKDDESSVPKEEASGIKSDEICNGSDAGNDEKSPDETPLETDVSDVKITPSSVAEVAETTIDAPSSVAEVAEATINAPSVESHVQNQNQNQEVSESEVQVAVNLAKSILQSAFPEVFEKETELTKTGSTSAGLQTDVAVEEPVVSVVKTNVTEESGDTYLQQSDIKGKSKEIEALVEPSVVEGASQFIADTKAHAQICNDGNDNEVDKADEKVSVEESSTAHSEPEKKVDAEKVPEKEVESDVVLSTGTDVPEIPIVDKSDDEDEGVDNVKEPESNTNDQVGETEQEQLTSHYGSAMEDQDVGDDEPEPLQNESVPVLPEVSNNPSEQEQETSQNEDVPEASIKSPDREPEPAVSNEQRLEEAELAIENDQALVDENPTIEESSPTESPKPESAVDELATGQLPEDLGPDGSLNTEEAPVDDTSFKDEDRNNQEDLGNYNSGTDYFQKPVSSNESDDVVGQSTEDDDQVSGHQASSPAVANASEEFFNWTDSTLKALLKTPGTTQASHVKDGQQSTVRFALPHEDDTKGNTTQNPDSSLKALFTTPATAQVSRVRDREQSTVRSALPGEVNEMQNPESSLKALFTTLAPTREQSTFGSDEDDTTTTQNQDPSSFIIFNSRYTPGASRVKDRQDQENIVKLTLPDEDDTKDKAPQDPLKGLFKTPATTRAGHMKDREQSTVRITLSEEDDTGGNATQNQDPSLKTLFKTPATAQISHVKERQQSTVRFTLPDEDDTENNATQNPASSLKAMFATPATTRISRENTVRLSLPDEDDNATQNPGSSLKASPATTQVSNVKDRQESTVRVTLPDEDDTKGNTTGYPGSSLKGLFATPGTSQISRVKESAVRFTLPDEDGTTQNQYSSLKGLFATPATARVTHVNDSQKQSTVRIALPDDIFDQDEKQGNATQNQGVGEEPKSSETFFEDLSRKFFGDDDYSGREDNTTQNPGLIEDPKSQTFEDFANKYFDDDDAPGDNLGKDTGFEFKYDQMDQEAAGTSHHDPSSASKDDSVRSGQDEKNDETEFSNK